MAFSHLGFRVAYDGKAFSGFQIQPKKKSVQAELERALSTVLRHPIKIIFSSRTDSGVHAFDQWIVVRNGLSYYQQLSPKAQDALLISINALLPASIRVWKALRIRDDFSPKYWAVWKEYRYRVLQGPICDPLLRDSSVWVRRELDVEAMKRAFRYFEGEHDFKAFAKRVERYDEKTKRKILSAKVYVRRHPSIAVLKEITFVVRGTGFLHHMVRTMVGTTLEIGKGVPYDIPKILKGGTRQDSGLNAPPEGLILWRTSVKAKFTRPLTRRVRAAPTL